MHGNLVNMGDVRLGYVAMAENMLHTDTNTYTSHGRFEHSLYALRTENLMSDYYPVTRVVFRQLEE